MTFVKILFLPMLCLASSIPSQAQFQSIGNPTGLVMDSDLNVWVTSFAGNAVAKLQGDGKGGLQGGGEFGTTAIILGVFPVGSNPTKIVCDCPLGGSGGAIWVTNSNSNNVTKLDMKTGANLGTFSVGLTPRGLAINQTSVWIANSLSNTITQLDKNSGQLIGTYSVGIAPYDVTSDGTDVWVANHSSNTVVKVSGGRSSPAGTILGTFPVDAGPVDILWDGSNIWVTSYSSNILTQLQGSTGARLSRAAMPAGPSAIANNGCNIWIASYAASELTVVDRNSGQAVEFFAMPTELPNPYGLVVNNCFSKPIATSYTNNFMGAFALE